MSLGITRKIDELGRIVVPKELRNTMNLKEGSLMEITANEDSIVMKKLSPLDRGREFAALIADTLSRQTDGAMVFVVSDDEIVAKCGANVVRVSHEHSDPNMAISSCFLKLSMETRDFAQIEEIKRALTKAGFKIVS